jgi:hypothetical protein
MADLADELLEHQYRESLSITTNREPHMTDQPNVEPPELGITLAEAQRHAGGPVEYVAGDLPDKVAFIERGRIHRVDMRTEAPGRVTDAVFVKFDNATTPKLTPLDRLRLLPWPEGVASAEVMNRLTGQHEHEGSIAEWAVRNEGMDEPTLSGLAAALHNAAEDPHNDHCGEYEGLTEGDAEFLAKVALEWMKGRFIAASEPEPDGPDESTLSGLAEALYSHGVAQDDITPSMDEHDAAELAKVALEYIRRRDAATAKPAPYEGMVPPAAPSWPQYQPAPYPMQWGDQPAPWGQPPAVPLGEVPDLIEQREWLSEATPRAAGERVIYRGRPTDPPLLALVVSVQASPSGVAAVAQYTVRVPYLGQTFGAFADQLASWYERSPG